MALIRKEKVLFLAMLFAIICVLLHPAAGAQESKDYEDSLKNPSVYNNLVKYLRYQAGFTSEAKASAADLLFINMLSVLFSLFCSWLALSLLSRQLVFDPKGFLWFLFFLNTAWIVCIFFFAGVWNVVAFLILKVDPGLKGMLVDFLCLYLLAAAVCLHIWIYARTFHLTFFGAAGAFLLSHVFYFLIIFIFSFGPKDKFFNLVNSNFSIGKSVQNHIGYAGYIAYGKPFTSFLRLKTYCL